MNNSLLRRVVASPLLRSTTVYGTANIIAASIPLLALPLLTRYLTPEDYGVITMFVVLNTVTAAVTGLSVHGAIWRQFHELDRKAFAEYIGTCLIVLAASTFAVAVIYWIGADLISAVSGVPARWVWVPLAVSTAQFVSAIALSLWQLENKPRSYAIFQVLQAATNVSVALVLVVGFGAGWRGSVIAQVLATVFFAAVAVFIMQRGGRFSLRFNAAFARNALQFGVPLIPHTLGSMAITMTDRVLITNLVGLRDTGVYALGAQVAMILSLGIEAFTRAYYPWLYAALRTANAEFKLKIVRFTYMAFLVFVLAAICLALGTPWFLAFYVGEQFRTAGEYVLWLSLAQAFSGMYSLTGIYIAYTGKTARAFWVMLVLAVLNYFICRQLIELNGTLGAAQSFTIINLLMCLVFWSISASVYPMPWLLRR